MKYEVAGVSIEVDPVAVLKANLLEKLGAYTTRLEELESTLEELRLGGLDRQTRELEASRNAYNKLSGNGVRSPIEYGNHVVSLMEGRQKALRALKATIRVHTELQDQEG